MPGFLENLLQSFSLTATELRIPSSLRNSTETLLFRSHTAEDRQLKRLYFKSGVFTLFVKKESAEIFKIADQCFPNHNGNPYSKLHDLWHSNEIDVAVHYHLAKAAPNLGSPRAFAVTEKDFNCLADKLASLERNADSYYLTEREAELAKKRFAAHLQKTQEERSALTHPQKLLVGTVRGMLLAFANTLFDIYFLPYLIDKVGREKALQAAKLIKLLLAITLKSTPWWHITFELALEHTLHFMFKSVQWPAEFNPAPVLAVLSGEGLLAGFKRDELLGGVAGKLGEEYGKFQAYRVRQLLPRLRVEPAPQTSCADSEVLTPLSSSMRRRA